MAAVVPDKRNGGCGVIFKDKLYVWGGQTVDKLDLGLELEEGEEAWKDMEIIESLPRSYDTDHPFDVLDLSRMVWSRQPTSGEDHEIPSLGLGSSMVVDPESECFLLFSGYNELAFDAEVYKIFPGDWKWEIIKPATEMKPTPRYLTGVIVHDNRLCIFGGVSKDIPPGQDKGAKFKPKVENGIALDYGWNNEYYEMDLQTSTWSAPMGKVRPDPIGGFAFPKIDPERALLFGGQGSKGRVNEAYLFYLDTREWIGPLKPPSPQTPWPSPTRFPTLTPLIPPELVGQGLCGCGPELRQRLLLLWGKASPTVISRETWLLEIELGSDVCSWKEVSIPLKPRSWHIGLPCYHRESTECQVVIFGGNMHVRGHSGERDNAAELRVLNFGVRTLARSCLAVIAQDSVLMEQALGANGVVGSKYEQMIMTAHEMYKNMPPLQ